MTAIALYDVVFRYPRGVFALCPLLLSCLLAVTLIAGPTEAARPPVKLMCDPWAGSGTLCVFGSGIEGLSLGEIGRRVGYLFQNPSRQLFAATVWQEMLFVPEVLGEDPGPLEARAEALLARFGLTELKDRRVPTLSRGEKQRLAICTMLMGGAFFTR